MIKKLIVASAVTVLLGGAAMAQTTPTMPSAGSETQNKQPELTKPKASSPSMAPAPGATAKSDNATLRLTDAEAKNWIGKAVYSSDGKNLGEVAAFQRDADGKVTQVHADIGGFLGLGETRVMITPAQFKIDGDRLVLKLTSQQAKTLPKIAK